MMRVVDRWIKEIKKEGMEYTIIQADIEGGFDKIEPRRVIEKIPKEYKRWIQSWCAERKAKFRFNGRTSKTFNITAGVPQGSPLSPYLFAIAMKNIAEPKKQDQKRQKALNLSYVDDFTLLIGAKNSHERKKLARNRWEDIKETAEENGMNFSDNKTKLYHSDNSRWHITEGEKPNSEIRILGYWIASRQIVQNHLRHWTNKARFNMHQIRSITNRYNKGPPSNATILAFQMTCRNVIHYGLERWGKEKKLIKECDVFIWTALRKLYQLPRDTPIRAISRELGIIPTEIEYQRRIEDQKIREGLYGHERKIWGTGERIRIKEKDG